MKLFPSLCICIFILNSCGNGSSNEDNGASNTNDSEEKVESDVTAEFEPTFEAFKAVDRYEDPGDLGFQSQNYQDIFYYFLPKEAEFNRSEKADHITYYTSEVIKGSQYIINIDDYSESEPAIKVDKEFTEFIHKGFIDYDEGEILHQSELNELENVFGFYSVIKYMKNDVTYTADQAHFGFSNYVVGLCVTGSPYGESIEKVSDFIGMFHLNEK